MIPRRLPSPAKLPDMLKKLPQNPIFLAAAATLAGIAVSLAVTKIALLSAGYPDIPVAFALAAALPAIVGPLTTFPLTRAHWRLRQMRIELERLANTDSLTALPNRRAFFEHAARMMARPRQEANPVTAMTIDIDRFMMINQSHGHDAGDAILCHIAAAIRDDVAASGAMDWSVARMGGEEFAVLAEGLVATAVARLAERICESARRVTRSNRDDGIAATVSVGVAFRVEAHECRRAAQGRRRRGRCRQAFRGRPLGLRLRRGRTRPRRAEKDVPPAGPVHPASRDALKTPRLQKKNAAGEPAARLWGWEFCIREAGAVVSSSPRGGYARGRKRRPGASRR
jgi:diguanylate cyclase (GGDEF)-like protein